MAFINPQGPHYAGRASCDCATCRGREGLTPVHETVIDGLRIKVEQDPNCAFVVTYHLQVKAGLNYAEAAKEYGICVFHALACAGQIAEV